MLKFLDLTFADKAFAMAPPPGDGGGGALGGLMGLLPLVVIFVLFYFLIIRPQQKQQKAHQEMLNNLKKGDKVITSGGTYGLVEQVGDSTVTLKIADGVKVKFGKGFIASVRGSAEED